MSENKDINDILGQLRASVDKSEAKTAGKTKKDKSDMFDREIAAMIEKQLNSRETATTTVEKPADTSPLLSDEIDLSEFVTEDRDEQQPIVLDDVEDETVEDEAVEDEAVEDEITEYEIVDDEVIEDDLIAPVSEQEITEDEPVEQEIVEDEPVEAVEEHEIADDEPVEEAIIEEDIPPAVLEALQAAFAVDDEEYIRPTEQQTVDKDEPAKELPEIEQIAEDEEITEVDELPLIKQITEDEEVTEVDELPLIEQIAEDEEVAEVEEIAEVEKSEEIAEPAVAEELTPVAIAIPVVDEPAKQAEPTEPDPIPADAWAYRGEEYRDHSRDETITADYNKARAAVLVKLIVSAIICGLVGFMENIGLFGFLLIRPFEPTENPGVFILTVLGLTLAAALMCLRPLRCGVVSLFKFDPEPHAITFVSLVISIIYDIVMLFVLPEQLMLYNFPTVLCLTLTLLHELLVICREKNSFDVVSSEGVRYSPRRESRAVEGRYNARHTAGRAGEHRRVYSMTASRFSGGYFRRTNEKKKGVYILNFMLLPLLAVAFVELVIALMVRSGVDIALRAFVATVQLALPVPLLLALVVPHLCASARLRRRGCAVLGESSVDEFSRPKLLVFEDRAMFPADRIGTKGLKLYDGFELYDVLVKTGSLFAAIGGPLGELFEAENAKYHRIRDVKLTRVERGGVEAVLEGKTKIIAGQIDFIEKYGIYPKRNPRDEQLTAEGVVSVIYIVIDSRPAARLYVDYRTDEAFEARISALCSSHDGAAICTSDPGIDENMISRKRSCGDYELAVIRPGVNRDAEEQDSFDSGIVSLGDPRRVIDAVNECHKIKKSRYISMMASLFVFLANIILATVLVVMDLIPYISSGLVVLYVIMLTLPVILLPGVSGGRKQKTEGSKND